MNEALAGWQGVQDSLASLSELEIGLYDKDGPVSAISGECPFCAELRSYAAGRKRCADECGDLVLAALASPGGKPVFFTCWCGLKVFGVRLVAADGDIAICGGKTFASRSDYDVAIEKLREMGLKVQNSGRHRYRFVGKKKLDEFTGSIISASEQYFGLSQSVAKYRLRLNRQAALSENASILYQVNELAELVDGFMRALESLFGLELFSIHLYGLGENERDSHFVRGADFGKVLEDAEAFVNWLRNSMGRNGEAIVVRGGSDVRPPGLSGVASDAVCMPVMITGELVGFVCVYDSTLSREDMEAFRSYVKQIAAAIDNRRLRSGVLEKLNRLKAMSVLYTSAGSMQDPDEICRLLLEKSTELLKAERGSLMMINEKTDELFVKFSKGIDKDVLRVASAKKGEGIAGLVARTGTPIVVRDTRTEYRPGLSYRPDYKTDSFVSVPLKVRGRVVGVVNLTDREAGRSFDHEDVEFLLGLASHAGNALERSAIEERTGELDEIVVTDELTGLLAWRQFNGRLAEELERSRRYGHALSLMVADVDGFSEYLEESGRLAADETLRKLAALFESSLRLSDVLSRYKGERFAFAMPETTVENAVALADRIRRRVEAARFPDGGSSEGKRLTISVGIAVFPNDTGRPRDLFDDALAALELAKKGGGNQVRTYGGSEGLAAV